MSDMNTLIEESWKIYDKFEREDFIVKPSIPVLFFGDSKRYSESKIKVITVGLNPSKIEFLEDNRFLRFKNAEGIYPRILQEKFYKE